MQSGKVVGQFVATCHFVAARSTVDRGSTSGVWRAHPEPDVPKQNIGESSLLRYVLFARPQVTHFMTLRPVPGVYQGERVLNIV